MRCPKCGYISYDHNQICPKCNKDISDEQAKLNLPTYKSSPPALLGMLVGAGNESNVGFTLDSDAALRSTGVGLNFEEASSMLESGSLDFGDDQDLEISLNDETGEFELPEVDMDAHSGDTADIDLAGEEEELSLDAEGSPFEGGDETADELGLDLGEVSMEKGDEGISDSLDGISPNDSFVLQGESGATAEEAGETMELGSVPGKGKKLEKGGKSTVELNVSDLKINETGELEINSIPDEIYSPKSLPEEDEVNIDNIEKAIELDSSSVIKKDANNKTGSLELGDLAIDEDTSFSETLDLGGITAREEGLDLGDLAIEAGESMELSGLSFNDNETGELNSSDFEEDTSERDSAFDSEKTVGFDDSLNIDLENLDLDLDLDDEEDKK